MSAGELVVEAEPEQTAVEGEPAVLLCDVSSNPPPRIRWQDIEEGSERIQEPGDEDFGVYKVSDAVTTSDAGTYRCTGQYSFGVEHQDIELVVLSELLVMMFFGWESELCWACCHLISGLCEHAVSLLAGLRSLTATEIAVVYLN